MPRHADPKVEGKIIEAARRLWNKGGEEALSMRAVARAAGTNTPAVYRRFKNRRDILRALVGSYQTELSRKLESCGSLPQLLDCVIDFALSQPREYELITSGLLARVTKTRPNVEFVVLTAADWMGGSPEENRPLVMTLWAMTHGLIMLKISGTMPEQDFPNALAAFHKSVEFLVENRSTLAGR
jgi:AcrR family transcriptional regulator